MVDLTDGQKKTVAAGLTALSLSVVFAFAALACWVVVKVLSFLAPVVTPLLVGVFLALFFKPYYLWLQKKVGSSSLAVLILAGSLFVPLALTGWYLLEFARDIVLSFTALAEDMLPKIKQLILNSDSLRQIVQKAFPDMTALDSWLMSKTDVMSLVKAPLEGAAGSLISGVRSSMSGVISCLVAAIMFFYFLTRPTMRGADFLKGFSFLKDSTRAFIAEQIDAFMDIVVSFFHRQVVICLLEGLMYGLGFAISGMPYGFLIGFALGLLNLVPLLGTVLCLPVALLVASCGITVVHGAEVIQDTGSWARLACVAATWAIGQVLDGYVITPRIQGNKTGLGYAGVIFSFFFWYLVFDSILGLLLAIPLSAFFVVLWRAVKTKYIKPVV